MKQHQLLTFSLLLLLAACKKDKNRTAPVQPRYFENSRLVNFGPYRLFTRDGEINDPALIQVYSRDFNNYFFEEGDSFSHSSFQKFEMKDDDTLLNLGASPNFVMKRTATHPDYDVYTGNSSVIINDTNTLDLHIAKYIDLMEQTPRPGWTYYEVAAPLFVARRRNDSLLLPITRYIMISRTSYSTAFSSDHFNNVFDPSGVRKLGSRDTLLLQTFDVLLNRK